MLRVSIARRCGAPLGSVSRLLRARTRDRWREGFATAVGAHRWTTRGQSSQRLERSRGVVVTPITPDRVFAGILSALRHCPQVGHVRTHHRIAPEVGFRETRQFGTGRPLHTGSVAAVARKPDWSAHTPDPRFDPWRERVGRLHRDGAEVGLLLVRVDVRANKASGYWWWTKWSTTYDYVWEWVILDGKFSDHVVVERDGVEQALRDYAAGRFTLGETLRVEWTTPEDASTLRQDAFGVDD